MKVDCDRERLLAAFQTASSVAPARSPKEILKNVKLDTSNGQATLLATDLEIGIRVAVEGVEIGASGSVILPPDRVGAMLRESTDARIRIESTDSGTLVCGERSRFEFPAEAPDEFPEVSRFEESKFHRLPARLLRQLVVRTEFATDNDSSRYALGGVLFELDAETAVAVATDGRRLATISCPAQAVGGHTTLDRSAIIPAKALNLAQRSLPGGDEEVQIAVRSTDVLFHAGGVTVSSRLVEGRYPRWRDVLPNVSSIAPIELVVGPTYAAVRQAAIITDKDSRGIEFTFAAGKMVLSGNTAKRGAARVEMPVAYDGPPLAAVLDPAYMADFLRVQDAERTFSLYLSEGGGPVLCTTEDGYRYVIMPLSRD